VNVGLLGFDAVSVKKKKTAEDWANAGAGGGAMIVWQHNEKKGMQRKHWRVHAEKAAFQADFNNNRAIVIIAACRSARNLADVGGRFSVGFTTLCNTASHEDVIIEMFDHMNGTKPESDPGTKRMAGDAFAEAKNRRPEIEKNGDPDTTLCPSVVHPVSDGVAL